MPTPDTLVPVDPDAPAGAAPPPPPVDRVARVYCVRHCDGAYYPLAVDVAKDKLEGLGQLCQAQCPGAESSAYSDADGDVAKAQAADGTTYDALPAAFRFQKETSPTCSCRGAGENWAQTLAKAETMIEAHKGDVIVTPEIQARMETPLSSPTAQPGAARAKGRPGGAETRQGPAAQTAAPDDRCPDGEPRGGPYARVPAIRADAVGRPISGSSVPRSGPASRPVSASRSGWNSALPFRPVAALSADVQTPQVSGPQGSAADARRPRRGMRDPRRPDRAAPR